MSLINASGISHSFGGQDVLQNLFFSVERNSRIGFVGKNGTGKSTLFNIMAGNFAPDSGQIHIAKNAKIAYLTQEPELNESLSLYDCVAESAKEYLHLSEELEKAETALEIDHSDENMNQLSRIQQEFELIDGYNFQTKMKLILTHLNFTQSTWKTRVQKFSGGEKTRIQLARFLLQKFDVMLLDEPTNHLDIEMIFWLERYLKSLNIPYVIISHDRHFLDKTVTKIAELKDNKIEWYTGNFSSYKEQKQARIELLEKTQKKQQKKVKRMENQIEQYRIWGRARDSEKMFVRAKELEKRLSKVDVQQLPKKEKNVTLKFDTVGRSGNDVYTFEKLKFGFPGKTLADNVNLRIFYKDKIAIPGKNGCGKTTLLKIIEGSMKPISGVSKKGASLKIGYYDQMHLELNENLSVMETIWELVPMAPKGYVFSYLARFGFTGDNVDKQVSVLSGGEKSRLYLAKLIHDKPNFLILDEPTNHLDIDMIYNLEDALQGYAGTIIFVSHDTYFIEKVATKKWVFRNGTIEETTQKTEDLFFVNDDKIKTTKTLKLKTDKKKINPIILNKLHSKIEILQNHINLLHEEITDLNEMFSDSRTFDDSKKVKEITENIKNKTESMKKQTKELDELEIEYLEMLE
jgi:ATP-binding cassette, subfamily F, member 3